MPRPHVALLLALAAAYGVSHFPGGLDPYLLDVLTGIGINIILAVSLNLVNGYTGQFSLGHAGFMSIAGTAVASPASSSDGSMNRRSASLLIAAAMASLKPLISGTSGESSMACSTM